MYLFLQHVCMPCVMWTDIWHAHVHHSMLYCNARYRYLALEHWRGTCFFLRICRAPEKQYRCLRKKDAPPEKTCLGDGHRDSRSAIERLFLQGLTNAVGHLWEDQPPEHRISGLFVNGRVLSQTPVCRGLFARRVGVTTLSKWPLSALPSLRSWTCLPTGARMEPHMSSTIVFT